MIQYFSETDSKQGGKDMAFGFFKKVEAADLILHNGHIFTQNPELPWASAVACKGDEILAVGSFDGMDGIIGDYTRIIDLDGKYVFPGFIDIHRSPVLKAFQGHYADLSECHSAEDVAETMREWAEENPDREILFGYGYRDDIMPDNEQSDDEISPSALILDSVCPDKPVLLLCANCISCWTNSAANRIINDTAEEELVDTITVGYVLNLLIPFDFDVIEESVQSEISNLADKGFTSVLNLQSPDYFENLYQDSLIGLYNEGQLRQRFFGSYYMNRPLLPKALVHRLMARRTNCLELGNMIHAEMLNLYLDNFSSPVPFSQDAINTILEDVCEKGFGVFLEAIDKEDLILAFNALEHIRSKGCKNIFVVASDYSLSPEESSDLLYWESAFTTWGTDIFSPGSLTVNVTSVEEAIDHLTVDGAAVIGMSDRLGRIETGMLADMAVFDENLFDLDLNLLPRIHAAMTVLGGQVVYDADSENDMEMYNLMASQQL